MGLWFACLGQLCVLAYVVCLLQSMVSVCEMSSKVQQLQTTLMK